MRKEPIFRFISLEKFWDLVIDQIRGLTKFYLE